MFGDCLNRRYIYGVSKVEVESFVAENDCAEQFLGRFDRRLRGSWFEYARNLCMFFKWLSVKESLSFSPKDLLNEHLRRRQSLDVEDRRWLGKLVLRFCRDNPDFKDRSVGYRYTIYMAIKEFFDFFEAPLTTGKGFFGLKKKRKNNPNQFDAEKAKKILGVLDQRERTICLMMLQSGQSIDGILNRLDLDYLRSEVVGSNPTRIRLDFPERKGNGFKYFSFISYDAIQELRKWLAIRDKWHNGSDAVFITRSGKPVSVDYFEVMFDRSLRRAGLKSNGFAITSHMFRKLFKTESSPPERGISQEYVEFMMGHASGIEAVGGIYDRTPEIYAEVVEREYQKLEPYLNLFSERAIMDESQKDSEAWKALMQVLDDDEKRDKFLNYLKSL